MKLGKLPCKGQKGGVFKNTSFCKAAIHSIKITWLWSQANELELLAGLLRDQISSDPLSRSCFSPKKLQPKFNKITENLSSSESEILCIKLEIRERDDELETYAQWLRLNHVETVQTEAALRHIAHWQRLTWRDHLEKKRLYIMG